MAEFDAGPTDGFTDSTPVKVSANGTELAIVRVGERLFAIGDRCSHAKASLSEGEVVASEMSIECPRHGASFDLETGAALSLPATTAVPVYKTCERDGNVFIDLPAQGQE